MLEVEELDSTTVTMDNWYSSPELIACLGYAGTCARATCRADRLLNAPVLNNKDLAKQVRGFISSAVSDRCGVLLTRWQDNACVTMLTNCDNVGPTDEVKRYDGERRDNVWLQRPAPISHYNKDMGGVDLLDRRVAEYRIRIKSKKWWWPHLTNTLQILLVCSYKLYMIGNPTSKLDLLGYIREVTVSLLPDTTSERSWRPYVRRKLSHGGARVSSSVRLGGREHWPEKVMGKYGLHCAIPECKSRVRTKCSICSDVGLCIGECWKKFHSVRSL